MTFKSKSNSKTIKKVTSKTKKPTCQYIFVSGPKKGKKCGRTCRHEFCCDHNPKKKEYKDKWYKEKREQRVIPKIEMTINKIRDCDDIDKLPCMNYYQNKIQMYRLTAIFHLKKMAGHKINMGENEDEIAEKIKEICYGKCCCQEEYDPTEEEIEEYIEGYDNVTLPNGSNIQRKRNMTKKQAKSYLKKTKRKCVECGNYENEKCRYCNHGFHILIFKPTCTPELSEKKIAVLKKKNEILTEKITNMKRITIEIEKRKAELQK